MNKLLSNKGQSFCFFSGFAIFLTFIIVPSSVSLYYSLHDWNGVGDDLRGIRTTSDFCK